MKKQSILLKGLCVILAELFFFQPFIYSNDAKKGKERNMSIEMVDINTKISTYIKNLGIHGDISI